jgi:hypothetical protein
MTGEDVDMVGGLRVGDAPPYVHFALDFQVFEGLGAEFGFAKGSGATGDWAGRRAVAEDSVDA